MKRFTLPASIFASLVLALAWLPASSVVQGYKITKLQK